ncbi:MAG TPA: histidine kinase [Gaiellaceae bacterium]|nr:histidine kinase [Gaiellaceae bacterium]
MLYRIPAWIYDLVIALIVGASSIGQAFNNGGDLWLTAPVSILATGVILFRRRRPLGVLAFETAATALLLPLGVGALTTAVVFSIWTVASRGPRRASIQAAAVAIGILAIPALFSNHGNSGGLIAPLVFLCLAWMSGDSMHAREHDRELRIGRAAGEERARIARELHDVVTHNVSVMVVQAAAAGEIFDTDPQRARDAIGAVEETGRRALNELRRLLGVVADDEAGVLPQPSLDRVGELVDRVRAAGLEVELIEEGTPGDVPEGIGLSAYRIVQESLTNTLKHAFASHVTVRVRHSADAVEVEVTDDGVGAALHGEGRGLIGMRERVALYGGELDAGSRADGGYGVRARIPVAAS